MEGFADVMAWRLCSYTIAGQDIEGQLFLVISLDKELFDDSFALQVADIARRLEANLTMQEMGDIAMELTNTCYQWRRANAEKFR